MKHLFYIFVTYCFVSSVKSNNDCSKRKMNIHLAIVAPRRDALSIMSVVEKQLPALQLAPMGNALSISYCNPNIEPQTLYNQVVFQPLIESANDKKLVDFFTNVRLHINGTKPYRAIETNPFSCDLSMIGELRTYISNVKSAEQQQGLMRSNIVVFISTVTPHIFCLPNKTLKCTPLKYNMLPDVDPDPEYQSRVFSFNRNYSLECSTIAAIDHSERLPCFQVVDSATNPQYVGLMKQAIQHLHSLVQCRALIVSSSYRTYDTSHVFQHALMKASHSEALFDVRSKSVQELDIVSDVNLCAVFEWGVRCMVEEQCEAPMICLEQRCYDWLPLKGWLINCEAVTLATMVFAITTLLYFLSLLSAVQLYGKPDTVENDLISPRY